MPLLYICGILNQSESSAICTDSHNVFGVLYNFGQLWKQYVFLPLQVPLLRTAVTPLQGLLPFYLAIVKYKAYATLYHDVTQGNDLADHSERITALPGPQVPVFVLICLSI